MADIQQTDILYGINPVTEALKASKRKCFRLIVEKGKTNPRLKALMMLARSKNVMVESVRFQFLHIVLYVQNHQTFQFS